MRRPALIMPPKSNPPPPAVQPKEPDKAAVDNRSVQLNPESAEYHKSRGADAEAAAAAALEAAKTNNPAPPPSRR